MKKTIVAFDLETNGFKETEHSVLSISALKLLVDIEKSTMEKIGEFERYYYRQPGEQENFGATKVNGLSDDVIEKKRESVGGTEGRHPLYFKEDEKTFEEFLTDCDILISHNTGFDLRFLTNPPNKTWCSMTNAPIKLRQYLGAAIGKNEKFPKLNELASYLNVPWDNENLHGSTYDTLILGRCLYRLLQRQDTEFIKVLKS